VAISKGGVMAYYTKVLRPNETVRYVGRLHWIIYKHAILLGVLAIVSAVVCVTVPEQQRPLPLIISAILLALAIVAYVRAWLVRAGTEIVVTDKRIIHKVGWIGRHTEEMSVAKVETVDVDQGISGRIFGFGAVMIHGTGSSWEPLRRVASPLQLRNAIIVD
jgi:uncharacterized membrane protein YdbT with pleckstrin-like domain